MVWAELMDANAAATDSEEPAAPRADRWYMEAKTTAEGAHTSDSDAGLRCQIWYRATRPANHVHSLLSQHPWATVPWQLLRGAITNLHHGENSVLQVLPKKIANFLHEFRGEALPFELQSILPEWNEDADHGILKQQHVNSLLELLCPYQDCNPPGHIR